MADAVNTNIITMNMNMNIITAIAMMIIAAANTITTVLPAHVTAEKTAMKSKKIWS